MYLIVYKNKNVFKLIGIRTVKNSHLEYMYLNLSMLTGSQSGTYGEEKLNRRAQRAKRSLGPIFLFSLYPTWEPLQCYVDSV